jgi:hypothetical protein
MSEGDERQRSRMTVGARLIAGVCAIADTPFVEDVENHFAGYFNELAITVRLREQASDADVIALQNKLLAFLNTGDAASSPDFTWLIKFSRGGKSLRSLFPGDAPRSSSEDIEETE